MDLQGGWTESNRICTHRTVRVLFQILDMRRLAIPALVLAPPTEWVIWKPVGHHLYQKSRGVQEVPTSGTVGAPPPTQE